LLFRGQRLTRSLRYPPPVHLGERRVEVERERVGVGAEFGDDKRHPVDHQPADEVDVARQPVQFRYDDRVMGFSRGRQCGGEHGSPLQRVGALARLYFDVRVAHP
jgi:hypothetical protein